MKKLVSVTFMDSEPIVIWKFRLKKNPCRKAEIKSKLFCFSRKMKMWRGKKQKHMLRKFLATTSGGNTLFLGLKYIISRTVVLKKKSPISNNVRNHEADVRRGCFSTGGVPAYDGTVFP